MITFKSLDIGSSFAHIWYILRGYGSGLYMKVIGSRSSHSSKKHFKNSCSHIVKLWSAVTSVLQHVVFSYGGSNGMNASHLYQVTESDQMHAFVSIAGDQLYIRRQCCFLHYTRLTVGCGRRWQWSRVVWQWKTRPKLSVCFHSFRFWRPSSVPLHMAEMTWGMR